MEQSKYLLPFPPSFYTTTTKLSSPFHRPTRRTSNTTLSPILHARARLLTPRPLVDITVQASAPASATRAAVKASRRPLSRASTASIHSLDQSGFADTSDMYSGQWIPNEHAYAHAQAHAHNHGHGHGHPNDMGAPQRLAA